MNRRGTAMRMLMLACVTWGLSFPTIKALALVQSSEAPVANTWLLSTATMVARFSTGALLAFLLVLFARGRVRTSRGEITQGIGLGLFGGLGMLLQVDGLSHTEASTSAFLTQATVFFIPLVKALWHRQLPTLREGICCVIALAGIAVLARFDWRTFHMGRGEAETLAAAVLFTGHIMTLEVDAFRGNDALKVSVVMFGVITALFLPLLLMMEDGAASAVKAFSSPVTWLFLAILVGPCTLLSFIWMNQWQPHVSATTAGLIYCLEPVFTSAFALFLPAWFSALAGVAYANEHVTPALALGGGLILLANVLMLTGAQNDTLLNEHGV
ncbi:MAG: DMT family transporter [Verrucomicrobiaceae bacterium]|nr:DMT family transporter [Verrucomicrobiaceae bacterium]